MRTETPTPRTLTRGGSCTAGKDARRGVLPKSKVRWPGCLTAGEGGESVGVDMGLNPARISMASEPPRAVVRIVGRAAVERARDFDGAIRALVGQGVRDVYLNLAECPLLDSTFSGTVAMLAEERKEAGPLVSFTLVAAKSRIVDGLANLEVLPLVKVAEPGVVTGISAGEVEVPLAKTNRLEAGQFCLRAHRALMALSAENRARFKELESMLAAEIGEASK